MIEILLPWKLERFEDGACRFLASRCASAIQIVRPLELIAKTKPQLQPAWLRLSATISQ